ncbi:hypothetical protein B0T20DRAFT_470476 [Sordaria brevicollis]|uniref:Uncharacterized protein n=1 Tax=Sordaria brevicollis TaxID=83679 RepID=A0AAE0PBF7_SORBR|nr:hypothetical protein B0T20DRAFT_470476 [Sordaria brevicollis]
MYPSPSTILLALFFFMQYVQTLSLPPSLPHTNPKHPLPPSNATDSVQLRNRQTVYVHAHMMCDFPLNGMPVDVGDLRRLINKLNDKEGRVAPPLMLPKGRYCGWRWVSPSCFGDKHEWQTKVFLCNNVCIFPTSLPPVTNSRGVIVLLIYGILQYDHEVQLENWHEITQGLQEIMHKCRAKDYKHVKGAFTVGDSGKLPLDMKNGRFWMVRVEGRECKAIKPCERDGGWCNDEDKR